MRLVPRLCPPHVDVASRLGVVENALELVPDEVRGAAAEPDSHVLLHVLPVGLGAAHGDVAVPVLVVVHGDVVAVKLGLPLPVLKVGGAVLLVGLVQQAGVLLVDFRHAVPAKRLERRLPERLYPAAKRHLVNDPGEPVQEPVVLLRPRGLDHGRALGVHEQAVGLVADVRGLVGFVLGGGVSEFFVIGVRAADGPALELALVPGNLGPDPLSLAGPAVRTACFVARHLLSAFYFKNY